MRVVEGVGVVGVEGVGGGDEAGEEGLNHLELKLLHKLQTLIDSWRLTAATDSYARTVAPLRDVKAAAAAAASSSAAADSDEEAAAAARQAHLQALRLAVAKPLAALEAAARRLRSNTRGAADAIDAVEATCTGGGVLKAGALCWAQPTVAMRAQTCRRRTPPARVVGRGEPHTHLPCICHTLTCRTFTCHTLTCRTLLCHTLLCHPFFFNSQQLTADASLLLCLIFSNNHLLQQPPGSS